MLRGIFAAGALGAVLLTALAVPRPAAASDDVIALVASNAKAAFTDIIKQFEAKHKGVTVKAQYLGGTQIGEAIDGGQPVDVILVGSGTTDKESQLLGPITPVLRNREIILVPKNNPGNVKSIKDLANPGVKLAVGTPSSAVGKLASQVIQNAAAAYGFAFVKAVRDNIKFQADKGSDVVGAVGNQANAAIAFESDRDDAKYTMIPIDEKYNVVSTYNMAVPKNAKSAAMGKALVDLVSGSEGQAILHKFGYMAPK
jgi:molybdate transport system substrate-binding protein